MIKARIDGYRKEIWSIYLPLTVCNSTCFWVIDM